MPAATAPAFLSDPWASLHSPVAGRGNLYKPTEDDRRLRERQPNLFADYQALFSPQRYRELVTFCRTVASRGLVRAALEQKCDYTAASHFRPTFTGQDEAYGTDLIAALEEAHTRCNLRGPRFDWRTTWRLGPMIRATDASYFVLLTEWADGWPAVQVFEGHRIWQRDLGQEKVEAKDAWTTLEDGSRRRGVYRGLRISQGIIYNEVGQEVAYRVLGAAADGSEDQDISARDMIHVSRPSRHSEGRPIPDLAPAVPDFLALDQAQTAQLDQQILDARRHAIESNASGKAPYNAYEGGGGQTGFGPDGKPVPTEVYERGGVTFIKSGFELKPWETNRPSNEWMNFRGAVSAQAVAAIRWRLEMLDPAALRGASNRALQDQINTCIQDEFTIDSPAALRVDRYFAAKLVQVGRIKNHPETRALGIAPPPYFEIDRNAADKDLNDVAAGRYPMSVLQQRDGRTETEVMLARARSYKLAEKISKETGVDIAIIRGDQGVTSQRQQQPQAGGPEAPSPGGQE